MKKRRIVAGVVAFGVASALQLGVASAHEGDHGVDTFEVVCDNNVTYTLESNGNGEFTSARDVHSNAVLVPVSFGEFTGTITYPDRTVETFTEPASSKGQSAKGLKNAVSCSFTFTFESDGSDGLPAGTTFEGGGTAIVKVTPSRK